MKYLLFLSFLLTSFFSNSQTKTDVLTNSTVIKLTKSKLPESVIIQKINQSPCNFDVSVDALVGLKENSVSDNVIKLMIDKQSAIDASEYSDKKNNSNDKNYTFSESGIYFFRDGNYIQLDPTLVSTTSPKGGLVNIKYKSQIEGSEANYQLNSKNPEFYFNFENVKKSLNDANANSSSTTKNENYLNQLLDKVGYNRSSSNYQAVSPNDFRLIKLEKIKNKREFVSGKIGFMGKQDWSIDDKNIVNFKYEKISANTYKIRFDKDLKPGEYCFLYLGNNNNAAYQEMYGQNNFKVFDFGITKQ